ncbi:hypothetical protein K6V98_07990 [Collinsella sp. AGMB00827]|uniref:F5/8 type C domain-containing protein n=1 Tax=Collinsella ureilytica TaxID=2869515 RepID=A0ABS7MLQ0_9ACTN|nr:hypothetical protein [Collinsella urealyticum]MBY4798284.1 hypothetical protein [Collinsella urealyticum]
MERQALVQGSRQRTDLPALARRATGDEGIISLRNPAAEERTLTFRLDSAIGARTTGSYHVVLDHGYTEGNAPLAERPSKINAGSEVSMKLKPGEVQIWHLSKDGDTVPPSLTRMYFNREAVIRVQASEHVMGASFEVRVDGKTVPVKEVLAYADLKTFDVVLADTPRAGATVRVQALSGADSAGNRLGGAVERVAHDNGVILKTNSPSCTDEVQEGVVGSYGFSVAATVSSPAPHTVLAQQGDEWSLRLNEDAHAVFTVKGASAISDQPVKGATSITGVRENNGMVKVYVQGKIAGSSYDVATHEAELVAAPVVISSDASLDSACVWDRSLAHDEVPISPLADRIHELEAMKGSVSRASWTACDAEGVLARAREALSGDAAAQQRSLTELANALNSLVPGTDNGALQNLARNIEPTAGWLPSSSTDPSLVLDNASPLSKSTDGVSTNRDSYSIFGNDDTPQPAYEQLDLKESVSIESVKLWRYWGGSRMYGSTALVISDTPDFSTKTILYYSGDSDVFQLGEQPSETTYRESSDGRVIYGAEASDKPVQARYVRLYMNGYEGAPGKENHVIEIEIMGKHVAALDDPYHLARQTARVAQAKEALAHRERYTKESADRLDVALSAMKKLMAQIEKEAALTAGYTVSFGAYHKTVQDLAKALCALEQVAPVEKVQITLDFGYDGLTDTVVIPKDAKLPQLDIPIREGYTFSRWVYADSLTAVDMTAQVKANMTLVAQWKASHVDEDKPEQQPKDTKDEKQQDHVDPAKDSKQAISGSEDGKQRDKQGETELQQQSLQKSSSSTEAHNVDEREVSRARSNTTKDHRSASESGAISSQLSQEESVSTEHKPSEKLSGGKASPVKKEPSKARAQGLLEANSTMMIVGAGVIVVIAAVIAAVILRRRKTA